MCANTMVRITFRGRGINHLINDILVGKCPSLSLDNLLYLEEYITEATQMERRKGELNKKRTDAINHFYYLDASIGSNKVVIVLAMEVIRGEIEVFPYSIYEKKKS